MWHHDKVCIQLSHWFSSLCRALQRSIHICHRPLLLRGSFHVFEMLSKSDRVWFCRREWQTLLRTRFRTVSCPALCQMFSSNSEGRVRMNGSSSHWHRIHNLSLMQECVHALEKTWHPECFTCTACKKSIGTGSFHVEEGEPYCIEGKATPRSLVKTKHALIFSRLSSHVSS